MTSSTLSSRVSLWLYLGLLAGVTHAVAEAFVLRVLGYPIQPAEVLLLAGLFGAGASVGLALLGLAVDAWKRKTGGAVASASLSVWVVGVLYLAFAVKTDFLRDGASAVMLWSLPGLVLLVAVGSWTQRRPDLARAGAAFVTLGAGFCALGVAGEELLRVHDGRQAAFLGWIAASFAIAALPAIAVTQLARIRLAPAALALLCVATAGVFVLGPRYYSWRAKVRTPVLGGQASGPNLILIVLDTVRADHLDLFGYQRETMPRLAARAHTDFDVVRTVHAPSSWTLPSHASLFTGVYPWVHGAHYPRTVAASENTNSHPLRSDIPTLAETMSAAGYQTAGIVANYGVLSGYGMDRGFTRYHAEPGPGLLAEDLLWLYRSFRGDRYKPAMFLRGRLPEAFARRTVAFDRFSPWARRAPDIREEASDWLDKRGPAPFFLFLNFMDAHAAYRPVEEDDGYFEEAPAGVTSDTFDEDALRMRNGGAPPPADRVRYYMGQYDAEMRNLDRVLDSFLDELIERGLFDDSMIVITSDHGEEFLEHGILEHGEALYDTLIRVPMLVKLPASAQPLEQAPGEYFQHVDLFPTAAAVLGFEAPSGLQGTVWGRGREYAFAETYSGGYGDELSDLAAVVIDDKKLVVSTLEPAKAYDLESDPEEQRPIIPPPAALSDQGGKIVASRVFDDAADLPADADPEMLDRLKSLGYIQ